MVDLLSIASRAIDSLEPGALVADALTRSPPGTDPVVILAVGKAAEPMAAAARATLGDRVRECVIAGPGWGNHPIPGQRSLAAGEALLAAARRAGDGVGVLALVSGGGSALAAVPAAGLDLEDKRATTDAMIRAGIAIDDINAVRKHISALKGGRLALAAAPARVTTMIISDVVSGDLSMVASGPTLADRTTYIDALRITARVPLPPAVRAHLEAGARGELDETPATLPGEVHCLADNRALVAAVRAPAGMTTRVLEAPLTGNVGDVAAALLEELAIQARGSLVVAGGEPTVVVTGGAGRGGRAHHLALLLAVAIDSRIDLRSAGRDVAALVIGSDGVDGSSGGAGALVDGGTARAIAGAGIDAGDALARFDSARALAAVGASLPGRPTGNNLADLVLLSVL